MPNTGSPQALAQAFFNAQGLHQQGRMAEAEAAYQRILMGSPEQIDTLHMLGVLLIQTERVDRGFALIDRALAIQPKFVDAHFNRAMAAMQLGRFDEALAGLDRVLALSPQPNDIHFTRGLVLAQLGRPADAAASFDLFLKQQPGHPDALSNRGVALSVLGQSEAALADFDAVVALQPKDAQAHFNRGTALKALGRLEEAKSACEAALALKPGWPDALVNRGVILKMLGRAQEAVADYDRALNSRPDHVQALISRGAALAELARSNEALVDYDRALELSPGEPLALFNRGIELLLNGQFEQGWRDYEGRKGVNLVTRATKRADSLPGPAWDGYAPLQDKTLFVYWEQGLGDTIQFCRYASVAADHGARVILSVQNTVRPVIAGFDPRVTVIGAQDEPQTYDFHAALMSLPGAFGATAQNIPAAAGYLTADAAQAADWARRLGERKRPRIGLAWSGASAHENDYNRSAPLGALAPLLSCGADWFCLQKDVREADQEALAASPIQRIEGAVNGFAPTAALIANLDLIISVDTSIAHLAAAMGKPTWVLLSTASDWRWLLKRHDSPWYESARLFRQSTPRDWNAVTEAVRAALAEKFG